MRCAEPEKPPRVFRCSIRRRCRDVDDKEISVCSTLEGNAKPPVRLDAPRDHHEGEAAPRRLPVRYCEISSDPWVSEDGREGLVMDVLEHDD